MGGKGAPPRGPASGALAGQFPDQVATGLPLLMGFSWFDDFCSNDDNSPWGEKRWLESFQGGGSLGYTRPTSATEHAFGLIRLRATSNNSRRTLSQIQGSIEPFAVMPPIGSIFAVKVRHETSLVDRITWAGFADDVLKPEGATSNDFVGVRCINGGNWFGVIRNATTETTLDLGVAASLLNSEYRILGFLRQSDGFHFFVADAADKDRPPQIQWFNPISGNEPNESLTPVIGVFATGAGTKGVIVDWFSLSGRTRRQ